MGERLSRREEAARDVEPYQTVMNWEQKKSKRQKKKDTVKENRKKRFRRFRACNQRDILHDGDVGESLFVKSIFLM
jgi:hypothetical protein